MPDAVVGGDLVEHHRRQRRGRSLIRGEPHEPQPTPGQHRGYAVMVMAPLSPHRRSTAGLVPGDHLLHGLMGGPRDFRGPLKVPALRWAAMMSIRFLVTLRAWSQE